MKNSNLITSIILVLLLSLISCSSDDDNPNNGQEFGSFELTVTGDIEATKSGFADFTQFNFSSLQDWSIDMFDPNGSSQTMDLSISTSSAVEDVSRPEPGTYDIGFSATDPSVFSAIYVHIPNGNFSESVEYSTLPISDDTSYGGTLTITTSTENTVSGSFEFTAAKVDDNLNITGEINVSGEFTANKRTN